MVDPARDEMRHSEFPAHVNAITGDIVDAVGCVRSQLGAGLLESMYSECLAEELTLRGRRVALQVPYPVFWRGRELKQKFRIDMKVDDTVLVELKAVTALHPLHFAQVLTYLRLSDLSVGLLINFNAVPLREGIHRLAAGPRN